jgi:hypothetical protein
VILGQITVVLAIVSVVIECNASGDSEQIRKTVDRGHLHARVKQIPISLVALAGIVICPLRPKL